MLSVEFWMIYGANCTAVVKNEVREFKMRHLRSPELMEHEAQVYVVSKSIKTNDILKDRFGLK